MAQKKRFQVRQVFQKDGRTFTREVARYSTREAAEDVAREERQFPTTWENLPNGSRLVAVQVVDTGKSYQENPSREANVVIGGGLGVLLGGILLGLPGALVGGGIGAVLGSESGDTRRRALENPQRTPSVMGCDTEAQTLIFDRRVFNTVGEAQKWARANGFKSTKVDTNINTYRLRQKLPSAFLRGSFRTVTFRSGVQAVIGCPRMVRRKNG